jgi:glutamate dehydrogenase/leucine dehydrogenase
MKSAFKNVLEISCAKRVNMRTAAFMLAIKRVLDVFMLRGVYA